MQLTENFNLAEFMCKDGTPVPEMYLDNVQELAENLQVFREETGKRVGVVSGYRTLAHNIIVKGADDSQHLYARAGDIVVQDMTPRQVKAKILELIKAGKMKDGGIGIYTSWVHYDTGPVRRWKG